MAGVVKWLQPISFCRHSRLENQEVESGLGGPFSEGIVACVASSGLWPHPLGHAWSSEREQCASASILYAVPMQLLAYDAAVIRGTDVDKPRNLAKGVTVE
jgi:hypothetical protein